MSTTQAAASAAPTTSRSRKPRQVRYAEELLAMIDAPKARINASRDETVQVALERIEELRSGIGLIGFDRDLTDRDAARSLFSSLDKLHSLAYSARFRVESCMNNDMRQLPLAATNSDLAALVQSKAVTVAKVHNEHFDVSFVVDNIVLKYFDDAGTQVPMKFPDFKVTVSVRPGGSESNLGFTAKPVSFGQKSWHGYDHPHVSDDICLGDYKAVIENEINAGRFSTAIILLSDIMRTYNKESPYVHLHNWRKIHCCKCGTEDYWKLSMVNGFGDSGRQQICWDCATPCSLCGRISGDTRTVNDKPYCPSCRTYCRSCDYTVCFDQEACHYCGRERSPRQPYRQYNQPIPY